MSPRRPFPRLRWAIRHPIRALDRSGFGLLQTVTIVIFFGAVVSWLAKLYLALPQ